MGTEFFYCRTCGTRVTGVELTNGQARRTATQIRCADCLKRASMETRRRLGLTVPTLPPP